jgi:NADP-dependent aldehyde dehydrogenase
MSVQPVLIAGQWAASQGTASFRAVNPATKEPLESEFPISPLSEIEAAIDAASEASRAMRGWPGERFGAFLERYADRIEERTDALVAAAHAETALPAEGRLKGGELPRTTNQLRQAAAAAREGTWSQPVIDTKNDIRTILGPVGPVSVFGPNNFPFAFNSIAGGDFAAAVAAGNPVIAKGHSSHPETTRLFAVEAQHAADETGMPPGFVQLIYRTSHTDGTQLVAHPKIGASGYTGSRRAGLVLKQAADAAGKPIYLELSSINPVFVLPGAIAERAAAIAEEFTGSCLLGTGQFCTNPGLVVLVAGDATEAFIADVAKRFEAAPVGTMLSEGVQTNFADGIRQLTQSGAMLVAGGAPGGGNGYCYANTLLRVDGTTFLERSEQLQAEAFGNSSLFVVAKSAEKLPDIAARLEGNLTGGIYSHTSGGDDALYDSVAPVLREKVGRLLNDNMPTGVAVSPAMNHGGPFPATGHPGFTAVGIPASICRFAALHCYDRVRPHRLPPLLQDANPKNTAWRSIDGRYTQEDVSL